MPSFIALARLHHEYASGGVLKDPTLSHFTLYRQRYVVFSHQSSDDCLRSANPVIKLPHLRTTTDHISPKSPAEITLPHGTIPFLGKFWIFRPPRGNEHDVPVAV